MTTTGIHPARTDATAPALPVLRRALLADAAVSGGAGVLLAAFAPTLDSPLGIPTGWLLGVGLFMVVYGLDLALVASRLPGWLPAARLVPAGNALWVAASILVIAMGAWQLTALGAALVLAQAAVVAALAGAQRRAFR